MPYRSKRYLIYLNKILSIQKISYRYKRCLIDIIIIIPLFTKKLHLQNICKIKMKKKMCYFYKLAFIASTIIINKRYLIDLNYIFSSQAQRIHSDKTTATSNPSTMERRILTSVSKNNTR